MTEIRYNFSPILISAFAMFQISLQNNAISEVAANTFLGLANLTKVDLRYNQIEKFASINSLALSNANDEDFRRDSSSTFDSSGSYPPAAAAALTSDETAAFDLHSTAFAGSEPSDVSIYFNVYWRT